MQWSELLSWWICLVVHCKTDKTVGGALEAASITVTRLQGLRNQEQFHNMWHMLTQR